MPNQPDLRLAHPDATEAIEQTLEAQAAIEAARTRIRLPELDHALAALLRAQAAKSRGRWERTGRRRRATDRQAATLVGGTA